MSKTKRSHRKIVPDERYDEEDIRQEFDAERFLKERDHPSPKELLLALREEMEEESFFELVGEFLSEAVKNNIHHVKLMPTQTGIALTIAGIQILEIKL